jgi:hypothetical protein
MGTKVRFAVWHRDGRVYVVRPPDWPRDCELSFTDQSDMQEWAKAAHVMLKDGNPPRRYNERFAARDFG